MNWRRRHLLRHWLRFSLWPIPVVSVLGALAIAPAIRLADRSFDWHWPDYGEEGARALMSTVTGAMLTFIVFVFSILLVVVQLASAQMTPRVIPLAFNDRWLKAALGVMVFTFTYCVGVLARIEGRVPELCVVVALFLALFSLSVFFVLIDRVGRLLRPSTILREVAVEGRQVIEAVYPQRLRTDQQDEDDARPELPTLVRVVRSQFPSGVVLAFDKSGLLELAQQHDCVLVLAPQVGDFVPQGDPLFHLSKAVPELTDEDLHRCVVLGMARTMEQDPAFSLRILVDLANKALSPAINDPSTAVLALDQIYHLLRDVGCRHLDPGWIRDQRGALRLVYRTPNWPDFIALGVTEIRQFGASSVQIPRRLQALLDALREDLPPSRHPALDEEQRLLELTIATGFTDPRERGRAGAGDTQGMGARRV